MIRSDDKCSVLRLARVRALALVTGSLLLVSACGGQHEKGATQVAAKVNDDEITVSQINFSLSQQRNLAPNQAEAAGRQLLERLIDQQLAVQKAVEAKLDRDPQTVQTLEAARREILARRYVETQVANAPKPDAAAVQKYYASKPGLFSDRKIYTLQRVDVLTSPDQRESVAAHFAQTKSAAEVTDWLTAQGLKFTVSPSTAPAENLPLPIVDQMATLKDGQSVAVPQQQGVSVLTVLSAQPAPKTLDEAQPAITQYLTMEAGRRQVTEIAKSLRRNAKIEYLGKFAASAPGAAASDTAPTVDGPKEPVAVSAPAPAAASTPSNGLDAATLHKGLGLK